MATTYKSTTDEHSATVSSLRQLEAESIEIIREAIAEAKNPVMMYSIGKDSSVLLELCRRAFAPGPLPMKVLHIDTTWKFREMISFRDETAKKLDINLIVYTNQDGLAQGMNPFRDGANYTDVMKTQALKAALDANNFDFIFGGARRDEEASRAKERVFSLRGPGHVWSPKSQRGEFWNNYNLKIPESHTMRVFPLSNWTELEVWQYISFREIEIVDLYFAKERPVVRRDGQLIMVDDERMPIGESEKIENLKVRFRTLGCYPLTAAVESDASTLSEIIAEVASTNNSERSGRLIDHQGSSTMETRKLEGYF